MSKCTGADRPSNRRRIAFVINSIGYGGAERALANILEAGLSKRPDWDIHLVILDDMAHRRQMPAGIVVHTLDARERTGRSIRVLRTCLAELRPNLVVSFLVRANVASACAGRLLGIPVIVCERMHLTSHFRLKYRGWRHLAARVAPRLCYRLATRILGVSEGVSEDLALNFGVDRSKLATINNPYDIAAIRRDGEKEPEFALPDRFIVAAGRLELGKNFAGLIRAFAASRIGGQLVIVGEGGQRSELQRLVTDLNLTDRVILPGYASNPFAIIARAKFFVSSSLNEGFPNALVEAMVLGKPIVATDCPSGPAEILRGAAPTAAGEVALAEYGMLVRPQDDAALAHAIDLMAANPMLERYRQKSIQRAGDFAAPIISGQYWRLFDGVAAGSGRDRASQP
ncbi:glycosyltransferase [Croceibacterium sp. TMG7-5b_MA50]|uniref:glycosyltransferase n=1 Tax=Croceibacterium sp. TMG7-5b_MA50 TaxID=3121290 RepID=UPI003221726C